MKPLILDIETGPDTNAIERMAYEPEPDARLKDPAKIQAKREEKLLKYLNESPLYAQRGRILMIGILQGADVSILEGPERDMLTAAWSMVRGAHNHGNPIVGHNILSFDLPFMARRSMINGIEHPGWVNCDMRRDVMIKDTMTMWQMGVPGDRISLSDLGVAFGYPRKEDIGKHFAETYAAEPAKAIEYLKNDLELTRACFEAMTI